jgi:Pilus assembly protein, PilO
VKRKPSQKALGGVIAAMLVLAAVAGYFLLISPQRSRAAELSKQAEKSRQEIAGLRALAAQVKQAEPIRVADLFRVTKAMPSEVDMPGVILELNRIARETGISFDSITPQAGAESNGAQVVPITVVFQGNYFELSDFLFRMRNLVGVRGGKLDATGRLFVVDTLSFSEGTKSFPQIQATLTISAFVYGSADTTTPAVSAPPAVTPPPASPAPPSPAPPSPAPPSPDTPPESPPSGASATGVTP